MSHLPDPQPPEQPPSPSRTRIYKVLVGIGTGLGTIAVLGTVAAVIWGDRFVNSQVLPRVEAEIEKTFERPVDLGDVKRLSLRGADLGRTILPPTETDATTATVETVEFRFDLRALLFQRTLKPHVVLISPDVNLVQAENGQWVELTLPEAVEEDPAVTLELQSIEVRDATVTASTLIQDPEAVVPRDPVRLEAVDAIAEFRGEDLQQVAFDVAGKLDEGRFKIQGEGELEQEAVKVNIQTNDLPTQGINILLPSLVGLAAGTLDTNLTIAAALDDTQTLNFNTVDLQGTARFRDGTVFFQDVPEPITEIRSQLRFKDQQVTLEETGLALGDVSLTAGGTVDLKEGFDLTAEIPAISLAQVQSLAEVELPVEARGVFQLDAQVTGAIETPRVRGQLTNVGAVQVDKVEIAAIATDFILTPEQFTLTELRMAPEEGGVILAEGQADITDLSNPQFQLTAEADLPTDAYARLYGVELPDQIILGDLSADIEAEGTLAEPSALAQWQLAGDASFPGSGEAVLENNLVTTSLEINPREGGTVTAQGQADIADLSNPQFQLMAQVDLPTDAYAQTYGVTLPEDTVIGTLTADVTAAGSLAAPTAFAEWQLSGESSFPGAGEVTLADNIVTVDNTRLAIASGMVSATAIARLADGDWQATVTTDQVPVGQFTPQAQGLLSANLRAAGNLNDLDLSTIQAAGDATISDALVRLTETSEPLLEHGDWTTAFEWQGDRIAIADFMAPGVQAEGTVGVDFTRAIPVGDLALDVLLREVDLRPFNSLAPATMREYGQLAGLTSFDGRLTGTLENPQLAGDVRLADLALNRLAFEPLAGTVDFSLAEGGEVDLRGDRDRIQLVVDEQLWPVSFEVRNQDFLATGRGEGRLIQAEISQFPLDKLDVQPVTDFGFGTVTGSVDATIEADLSDFNSPVASGTLTVTQPSLDPLAAQLLSADFSYADNTATLEQGELRLDNSQYLLTGNVALAPELQYDGELTIVEGRIEELVAIAETLDLRALGLIKSPIPTGTAADLDADSVGLPNASFAEQIQAFVEFVENQPDEVINAGNPVIPPLEDLSGGFSGSIALAGQGLDVSALTANFDLQGGDWEWGPYTPPNRFIIQGSVEETAIALEPVFITAGETNINLSGRGTLEELTGTLQVDDLPLQIAQAVYPLPVALAGDLDLITTFDGSLVNPLVAGEAVIVDAQVNQQPIDQIGTAFEYRNATLTLDGEAAIDPGDASATIEGTIPYGLPFPGAVEPRTDRIALKAVVPSDSFDLVNTLTEDQIRWESGRGEAIVQVGGTLSQPVVMGEANLRDGVVSTVFLDTPLTDIDGAVQFNLEQVRIQQLQANLDEGLIEVSGQIPFLLSGESVLELAQAKQVAPEDPSETQPGIAIALKQVPVDYSGILQAVFEGHIDITGALLEPTIGGLIEMGQGQIQATELLRQAGAIELPTQEETEGVNPYRADYLGNDALVFQEPELPTGFLDKVALQDFTLIFTDRLTVAGQPFYNITAIGDITVNGTIADLRPEGTIELDSGWINLFSTQFRLDSSAPNKATFTPENGLDPVVDVVLTARVQESDVTPTPPRVNGFAGSEINDSAANTSRTGQVQYVNVQAIAQGPASQLNDNISLTSNPRRSEEQIVALLGSGFASGLTSASLTQVGGFLGAGSLAGFGNNVAEALGLRSFSVFPTTDTSTESTAGIGIGMEASFGIGDRLGISVLQILNNGNPPQVGVQYRFTDQIELRGSSNLTDTEVRLEYKTEF